MVLTVSYTSKTASSYWIIPPGCMLKNLTLFPLIITVSYNHYITDALTALHHLCLQIPLQIALLCLHMAYYYYTTVAANALVPLHYCVCRCSSTITSLCQQMPWDYDIIMSADALALITSLCLWMSWHCYITVPVDALALLYHCACRCLGTITSLCL